MRQQTILSKTITKLKPSQPKKIEHVSTKIQEERKSRRTKTPSTSQRSTSSRKSTSSQKTDTGPKLLREPKAYLQIQEVPTYEPTELEFAEPLLLLRNLRDKGYAKYGAVKFKAPDEWLSEFAFNPAGKNIITRKQLLKNMIRGKSFEANQDGYSLDEFKNFTDKFAREYIYHAPHKFESIYRANEYEYWAHVEDPQYAQYNLTVEYAADLPSKKYGSGFPTVPGRIAEEFSPEDIKTHPFNLNNLGQARDGLFQVITTKSGNISGISDPWVYVGMLFASFCWHVEDLYMYSVNYMHKGSPKTWYCIPEAYKEAFDDTIKEKYGELFIMEPALMYNITQTMNPLELVKRNIPVYRTEQKPGEFIITFPKVYHAGISHGFNVAEAVNLATVDWIPYAKKAMDDYALDGFNKKGSFPYEWLIIENVMRLPVGDVDFTKDQKTKLLEEYKEVVMRELENRNTVQKCYKRIGIKKFQNSIARYDAYECNTCKNYTYLSFLNCVVCEKKACIKHITVCDCLNASIIMNVRFTDQELEKYLPAEKRSSARNKGKGNKGK